MDGFSPGGNGIAGLFDEGGAPYIPSILQSDHVPFGEVARPLMAIDGASGLVHFGLDVAGSLDPTPLADGLNAIIYAFQGDPRNAGISLAGAFIPVGGDFLKPLRFAPDLGGAIGGGMRNVPPASRTPSFTPAVTQQTPPPLTILNPHFTPNAPAVLQNLTNQQNALLAANPALAATVLTEPQIQAAINPHLLPLTYGNALEGLVAREIGKDPILDSLFSHVGGPGQPDFTGAGLFQGMNFDITTPAQVNAHLQRPYGQGLNIITYERPAGFK